METIGALVLAELHDAKIGIIQCDYDKQEVTINLTIEIPKSTNKEVTLIFSEVDKLEVGVLEPWGAGIYVNEIVVVKDEKLTTKIILNSGDDIIVISNVATSEVTT